MNMVLVNDSVVAPAANDENWQPCNTYAGGIMSAPLGFGLLVELLTHALEVLLPEGVEQSFVLRFCAGMSGPRSSSGTRMVSSTINPPLLLTPPLLPVASP